MLHTLGPRYKIVKPEYTPNKANLDSSTTQRENYQQWPAVPPPKRRHPVKWQPAAGAFDGTTTTKSDYVEMDLPAPYVRPQRQYIKSEHKMDGESTQVSDYKKWDVTSVPTRRKSTQAAPASSEDRYQLN